MIFAIEQETIDGFETVVLIDKSTDTRVVIAPQAGAILHGFQISLKGEMMELIDHYGDAEEFRHSVAEHGFKSCKLSPFACRVKNSEYQFNGQAYTLNKFILGKNALHGLLYDCPFSVIDQAVTEHGAAVVVSLTYDRADEGYPFPYQCQIRYLLKADRALEISTHITNLYSEPIPMMDGWHPYFHLGAKVDELELQLNSSKQVEMDDELIPTGAIVPYDRFQTLTTIGDTAFDDCFELDALADGPACTIRNPATGLALSVTAVQYYPFLQLYTPGHRNCIALENLSAAPDCFNNGIGLQVIAPGETICFQTQYQALFTEQ